MRSAALSGAAAALEQRQRRRVERHAAIERRLDRVEPRRRLGGGTLLVGEAHAVAPRGSGSSPARAAARPSCSLAGGAPGPLEPARDRARVAEVLAHQRLDPLLRAGAEAAQPLGRHLLQVVGQHVRVAARSRDGAPNGRAAGSPPPDRGARRRWLRRYRSTPPSESRSLAAATSRRPPGASLRSGSS